LRPSWWPGLLAAATGLAACSAGIPTEPAPTLVEPGLYVLTEIGGAPAPHVIERSDYGDTMTVTLSFAFDSIRILDESTFTRHFRRELILSRPPAAPILEDFDEFGFGGLILRRDGEVKLTVRTGFLPGGHDLAYLSLSESGAELQRQTVVREFSCTANRCDLLREERVTVRYARR